MERLRWRQYHRVGTVHGARQAPASITVTARHRHGLSGTATLNVTAAQGVLVSPSAVAIAAGATQSFAATVNGAAVTATWEVNGQVGGDGLHGTIDSNGNYIAPASPPPGGSTTITAITGSGSSTVSGTATVAVFFQIALSTERMRFLTRGTIRPGLRQWPEASLLRERRLDRADLWRQAGHSRGRLKRFGSRIHLPARFR